jgi:hypothetical protein
MTDHLVSRLYIATVQNRRCLALLNHIVRDHVVIGPRSKRPRGPVAAVDQLGQPSAHYKKTG